MSLSLPTGNPPASSSEADTDDESDDDRGDPLRGFNERVVPSRGPTAAEHEVEIPIEGLGKPLRLSVDAAPGCGGMTWPSGEVMSRYIAQKHAQDPSFLRDRKIIELGSGTGLVGLIAGLLEPTCECWITDQAQLLPLMRTNVTLNFPPASHTSESLSTRSPTTSNRSTDVSTKNASNPIHIAELAWGEPLTTELDKPWDLVLAADCVYFEPTFPLLVDTLCRLAPVGTEVQILFCWKKRRKADNRFFKMLAKHFASSPVTDDRPGEREKHEREGIRLCWLRRVK